MSKLWKIYRQGADVETDKAVVEVHELEYHGEWMKDEYVSVTVKSHEPVEFRIGDWLEYRGDTFVIDYDPNVIKKARRESYGEAFVYDNVKLYSLARELRNVAFKDYVLNWDSESNTNAYSAQDKFSFFAGSVDDLADRIQANLDRALGKGTWRVMTPNEFRTNQRCSAAGWSTYYGYGGIAGRTDISINADTINCEEALAAAYEQFGMSYVAIGRLIVIGGDPLKVSKEFMYGKGKGLYEIERTTDDNSKVVTRLSAYGSSQNLPLNYYANLHKKAYAIVKWPIEVHETQFKRLDLVTDIPWSDVKDVFTTVNDVVLTNASGVSVHSEFYAHKETTESPQVLLFRLGLWVEEDMSADWIEKKAFFDSLTIGSKVYLSYGVDINAWPQTMVEVGQDSMKLLTINNVMMPGFPDESLYEWIKENGGTDCDDATGQATYNGKTYILSQDLLSPWIQSMKAATMGVREGSIYFDGSGENKEIMPSIEDTGADVVVTGSNIQDNGYVTEAEDFKIVVANGILDWENAIGSSDKLTVSMKTGYCVGREFEVKKAELKDNGYELTLVRQKDGDRYFPYYDNSVSGYCQIKATDKFVVLGLNVQSNFDGYVQAAAVKVLEAALESLDEVDHIEPTYIPKIDEIYMARQHDAVKEGGAAIIEWGSVSLHDTFRAGMQMEITDKEDLQVEHLLSYIDTITIKENGNNGIPTYDVVLRNKKDESVLKKLEKKIVDVSSGGISAKGGTISSGGGSGSGSGGGGGTSGVYLSKRDDDEAQGVIGFLNGLWVGARDWFFDQLGNIKANTVTTDGDVNVGGAEHVSGDANIDGLLRVNDIKSTNYTGEGLVGTGYMITNTWGGTQDSGAVFDYLTIRKKMIINSLEIKETEFSAGDQAFSGANMKVARTDYLHYDEATNTWTELGYSTTRVPWVLRGIPFLLSKFGLNDRAQKMYARLKSVRMSITTEQLRQVNRIRLYFLAKDGDREIENWWRVNDLARCQTQNLINTQQRETYVTNLDTHQGNIYWWRKVMRVSVNTGEPRYIWYDEDGNTSKEAVEGWTKKRGYNGTVANEVGYPGMTEDLYPTKAEDYGQPITIDGRKYHWIEVAYNYDEEVAAFAQGKHTGWCACYSDLPAVNDKVVQFGNAEDPDRMNLTTIEINGSGNPDAPAIKIYRGIFSFDNAQSWWGGKPQKMKLSPSTGYEFYGPMFKFVQEYGVARIHKAREEVYWSRITFERDDDPTATYPAYSDDKDGKRADGSVMRYVRKCYYYDEVTHKGSLWLCTIANETYYWRWDGTSAITINGHTYQQGDRMLDSDYRSLTTEQKAMCGRYRSYATTEPSEASGEWTKIVEKGDKGAFKSRAFVRQNTKPDTPTGGDYTHPWPNGKRKEDYPSDLTVIWYDGVPQGTEMLWSTICTFYSDGTSSGWSEPGPETDTATLDIEFSPNEQQPANPYGTDATQKDSQAYINQRQTQGWYDPSRLPANRKMIWRAECKISNGAYELDGNGNPAWVVTRIYGEKGDAGSSPIALYRWYQEGATVTTPTVTAAQWAADQLQGWSKTAPNRPDNGWHLYMSQNTLYFDGSIGTWSTPIQISGATGTPGEDSDRIEWIYKLSADLTPTIPTTSPNTDGYVPTGWTNHPTGVDATNIYELACYRTKDAGANIDPTKVWSAWKGTGENPDKPIVWSHWGRNGMDGDGFEYAFIRTKNNVAPTILNDNTYVDTNGNNYTKEEHLPQVDATGRTDIENNQNCYQCTDDHKGTSREWPYEWCAKRTMGNADTTTGKRTWKWYSGKMKLWGSHPENIIVLDIDNEMDTVQTESDGKIKSERKIITVVRLYDGEKKADMNVSNIVSVTGGPTSTIATYANPSLETGGKGIILSWTFKAGKVMAAAYDIVITYNYVNSGLTFQRSAQFTITASMGQAVYQLSPSLSVLPCTRNQNGSLTNPSALSLRIIKLDGSSTNMVDATSQNLSTWGLVVKYAKGANASMPSTKDDGTLWPTNNSLNTILSSDENVYIAMFKSDGALLDRETIPIVKDGAKGDQGGKGDKGDKGDDGVSPESYSLVASPSSLNFRTDPTGSYVADSLTTVCKPVRTVGDVVTDKCAGEYYFCYRPIYTVSSHNYTTVGTGNNVEATVTAYRNLVVRDTDQLIAIDFVLSSQAAGAGTIIASLRVPIMADGLNGEQGATGRMFYSMGEWSTSKCPYSRTDTLVPMVHYGSEWNANLGIYGRYYYLDSDEAATTSDVPGASQKWVPANDFGVVITQALFANFAKLGEGIYSGSYEFSMDGRIGRKEYLAGATIGTSGIPAYTYFVGDPHASIRKKNIKGRTVLATLNLKDGMKLVVKCSGSVNAGNGYINVYQNGVGLGSMTLSSAGSTREYEIDSDDAYTIEYYGSPINVKATFNLEYNVIGAFEPNWMVNLRTGKMVAARGNFIVDPDGTVKALNFFHNICVYIEGNHYSYYRYYCTADFFNYWRDNWVDNFTAGEYYTAEEVYDLSEGEIGTSGGGAVDGMERCTYDADIISMVPKTDNWREDTTIYLPSPDDFEGKIVELYSFYYGNDTTNTFKVSCVEANRMAGYYYINPNGKTTVSDQSQNKTLIPGTPAKFMSVKVEQYNKCYWVMLSGGVGGKAGTYTFTTKDNKTVTVVDGIITNIV